MIINASVLKNEECVAFRLRDLYRAYGYAQFKMSKFEEYDLYARNKDFLVSDSVITFTDTNGKLMALKPDVTLSIVKNSKDGKGLQKVYYDENVYRVSGSTRAYREIMQTGLECIGDIDDYALCEVLVLAVESLSRISSDYVLDVSQLDIVSAVIDELHTDGATRAALLVAASEKNLHGIGEICATAGVAPEKAALLRALIALSGTPQRVFPQLRTLLAGHVAERLIDRFEKIVLALVNEGYGDRVHIDFSVVHDMSYYNGIVFKGFVNGVPAGVLSGGQYDGLMQKMGRGARAIGFAVYLDLLERFGTTAPEFDVDAVLLYKDGCDMAALSTAAEVLRGANQRVTVCKKLPDGLKCKKLLAFENGEVKTLETYA